MDYRLHILIVDDDDVSLAVNQTYVQVLSKKLKKEVCIHKFMNWGKALKAVIERGMIDIAFLDIDLKEGDGISIAKELQKVNSDIPIIFITSHEEYISSVLDIMATGYIPKPIINEKFYQLYKRAIIQAEENKNQECSKLLTVKVDRKDIAIQIVRIISIEKIQRKVIIHTEKNSYETNGTLSDIETKLLPRFQRINQGVIVNMNEVIGMDRKNVRLSDETEFTIGVTYAKKVLSIFNKQV